MKFHISTQKLKEALRLHCFWLNGKHGGQRANFEDFDLSDVDLCGADLAESNLSGANLQGANLCDANLHGADLRGAICDFGIQKAWCLMRSKWLRSDIPWWLGHDDQHEIVLCDQ